jgi:orotate phosphoribosyltransferase
MSSDQTRSPAADRARLIEVIKARSYLSGVEIRLASGRMSNFYFNLKPTMLNPEGAHLIGHLVVDAMEGLELDAIGGLEVGAIPMAAAAAAISFSRGRPLPAFFVRKAVKEHGTRSLVEGLIRGQTLAGKRVVIIEDTTTTGGSPLKACKAVEAEGAKVVRIVTIVDREEGAAEIIREAGYVYAPILSLRDFL